MRFNLLLLRRAPTKSVISYDKNCVRDNLRLRETELRVRRQPNNYAASELMRKESRGIGERENLILLDVVIFYALDLLHAQALQQTYLRAESKLLCFMPRTEISSIASMLRCRVFQCYHPLVRSNVRSTLMEKQLQQSMDYQLQLLLLYEVTSSSPVLEELDRETYFSYTKLRACEDFRLRSEARVRGNDTSSPLRHLLRFLVIFTFSSSSPPSRFKRLQLKSSIFRFSSIFPSSRIDHYGVAPNPDHSKSFSIEVRSCRMSYLSFPVIFPSSPFSCASSSIIHLPVSSSSTCGSITRKK